MKKFIALVFVASTPAFAIAPVGKVTEVNVSVDCDSGHCDLLVCTVTEYASLSAQGANSNGRRLSGAPSACEPWLHLVEGIGGDVSALLSTSQSGECIEKWSSTYASKDWAPSKRGCSFGN